MVGDYTTLHRLVDQLRDIRGLSKPGLGQEDHRSLPLFILQPFLDFYEDLLTPDVAKLPIHMHAFSLAPLLVHVVPVELT